jgi:dTDP-4-dehydrorhamnose reductase
MRILLTGKGGQVGHELRHALAPTAEVIAVGTHDCDFTDTDAIEALVSRVKPHVIINPAAYTAVDKAESEPDRAAAINATAPGVLAKQAQRLDALLIHYSTDYVFDGTQSTPYTEADRTNPQSVYGATKLAGETAIQQQGARHLILRTSWVYGLHGQNFPKTMLRLAAERETLNVVADQWGAPTSASLLANVTAQLLSQPITAAQSGVYHVSASGRTNWHAYACRVIERARALGWPLMVAAQAVNAIPSSAYPTPAKRPPSGCLDTTKFQETFGIHLPSWDSEVDAFVNALHAERETTR